MIGRCLLTQSQVDQLLKLQASDPRALGEIAADYFGLATEKICQALAEHIERNCSRTNLTQETMDHNCLQIVRPQEAWFARVLPMRVEQGVLICATTTQTLSNAIRLFQERTSIPVRFTIAPIQQLEQYLCQLYEDVTLDVA